jgi:competence protein ComEA
MLTLGAWWWTSMPPEGTDLTTADSSPPTTLERFEAVNAVVVHVAGEVRTPGVVRLDEGARVVDAIEAAGGATERAVLAGVNLAAEVVDGTQIVVPSRDAVSAPTSGGDGRIALNTATASELETLPGVGPVLAGRIVAHREGIGAFAAVEDLLDVSGIGEAILARLRPLVRVP